MALRNTDMQNLTSLSPDSQHSSGGPAVAAKSPLMLAIANSLKSLRIRNELSQEQLGERAGIARSFISGIEGCKRKITISTLDRLLSYLDTSYQGFVANLSKELGAGGATAASGLSDELAPWVFLLSLNYLISVSDKQGRIVYASKGMADALGFKVDDLVGRHYKDLQVGEKLPEWVDRLRDSMIANRTFNGSIIVRHRQGHGVNFATTVLPVHDASQTKTFFVVLQTIQRPPVTA